MKTPKPAATIASRPPVIRTLTAAAAPVELEELALPDLVALSDALPLFADDAEAALDVADVADVALACDDVDEATIKVVVPYAFAALQF